MKVVELWFVAHFNSIIVGKKMFFLKVKSLFFPLLAHHFVCEKKRYIEDIFRNQTLYF